MDAGDPGLHAKLISILPKTSPRRRIAARAAHVSCASRRQRPGEMAAFDRAGFEPGTLL